MILQFLRFYSFPFIHITRIVDNPGFDITVMHINNGMFTIFAENIVTAILNHGHNINRVVKSVFHGLSL